MKLIFHPDAVSELMAAVEYYDDVRVGLGDDFAAVVERRLGEVTLDPTSWAVVDGDVRRARVPRFPYDILFAVRSEEVEVVAIAHHHRRPGYWKYRSRR